MDVNIGVFISLITAIVAAYLASSFQTRLKAYEILERKRENILEDISIYIKKLHSIKKDLKQNRTETIDEYLLEFHDSYLILYHKVKGGNFGKLADVLNENFRFIISEAFNKKKNEFDVSDWVNRQAGMLSSLYGFAHSRSTIEIERLAFPFYKRVYRKYISERSRLKTQKHKRN